MCIVFAHLFFFVSNKESFTSLFVHNPFPLSTILPFAEKTNLVPPILWNEGYLLLLLLL